MTPDTGSFLFDVGTLQRVYDIAGTQRVPLGLLNAVYVDRANARRTGFYAGSDLPSDEYLSLSVIAGSARDGLVAMDGRSYVSYEWWFVVDDNVESLAGEVNPNRAPGVRIALREADPGGWAVYQDSGLGWTVMAGATYQIGEYEVSARVPLAAAWGMDRLTTRTFFRAVTRSESGIVGEDRALGYVFPDDLSWREVVYY
ncbi:MAG: hypothetical protein WEC75_14125 [Dehalococcoidia bacterium]